MNTEIAQQEQEQQSADSRAKVKQIGNRGFIIFDGTGYYYVTEEDWRALDADEGRWGDSLLAVQDQGETLFVNLDMVADAPTENT